MKAKQYLKSFLTIAIPCGLIFCTVASFDIAINVFPLFPCFLILTVSILFAIKTAEMLYKNENDIKIVFYIAASILLILLPWIAYFITTLISKK